MNINGHDMNSILLEALGVLLVDALVKHISASKDTGKCDGFKEPPECTHHKSLRWLFVRHVVMEMTVDDTARIRLMIQFERHHPAQVVRIRQSARGGRETNVPASRQRHVRHGKALFPLLILRLVFQLQLHIR
jgi:hypothetical protein